MAAGGTVIERPFSIPRDDGTTIRGDLRLAEGETPVGAVVVAHGFKGFKDWGLFPYLCQRLAEGGHAVVSFNFSLNGIGDYPTEFTELEDFARNTFSRDVDEILIVLEQVRSGGILAVPPTRLGLLGHSRGGGGEGRGADRSPRRRPPRRARDMGGPGDIRAMVRRGAKGVGGEGANPRSKRPHGTTDAVGSYVGR